MESKYCERAKQLRAKGYNCAQAVACAFQEEVGLPEPLLFSLSEGFGGGMGGHAATCGSVSGAVLVLSLLTSKGSVELATKSETYRRCNEVVSAFREKNQSLVCSELLGENGNNPLRSCDGCIEDAVLLVQNLLQKEGLLPR